MVEDKTSMIDGRRVRVVVSETAASQGSSVNLANVALRWLIHHSMLTDGDGIILGVSKDTQLVANLAARQEVTRYGPASFGRGRHGLAWLVQVAHGEPHTVIEDKHNSIQSLCPKQYKCSEGGRVEGLGSRGPDQSVLLL